MNKNEKKRDYEPCLKIGENGNENTNITITQVSNNFLQDKNLSMSERGLLATMLSLPDEWDFTIANMRKIAPDGETKIKSTLNSLINKGYITKTQSKNHDGKFGRTIIEVNERPIFKNTLAENQ